MKTIKIKENYTITEGLEWKLRCSKHQDEGGKLMDREGYLCEQPTILFAAPDFYEIIPQTEQVDKELWDRWGDEKVFSATDLTLKTYEQVTVNDLYQMFKNRLASEGGEER